VIRHGFDALTTLNDVVLATGIHHGFIVCKATQAHPACHAHDVPGCAGTLLTLGDGGQAAIGV